MQTNHSMIVKYEYKRCFSWKMLLWTGICFLAGVVYFFFFYREKPEDVLYREIVARYEGPSKEEKIEEIKERTAHYEQTLDDHDTVTDAYARDRISDEEFEQFIEDYRHAKIYVKSWKRLEKNALRFEEQGGGTCFFYDTPWNKLFSNQIAIPFLVLLFSLLIPYFYLDADSGFEAVGQSYSYYRKVKRFRLRFALVVVCLLQLLWMAEETALILLADSLPDAGMSACSLPAYSGISPAISLRQLYVIRNFVLLIKRILDTLLLSFMADRIKGKMQTAILWIVYLLAADSCYMEVVKGILCGI